MIGRVTILCVGKLKEAYWRDACAEYQKRITPFFRLDTVEVAEERLPTDPTPAQIRHAIEEEGKRLLKRCPAGAATWALCVEGTTVSSPDFAALLDRLSVSGNGHVAFFIGGSYGLSDEVKAAADRHLSFSPLTFPHQLARVLLLEQLYRAAQISSGGKYHK